MSTNNSRENIICRTQGSGQEQWESERKRARINWGRMSEEDRQRRHAWERERRRNYSEERQQAERVRARENRQNVNEEHREAERLCAVENRQNCSEECREAERLCAVENRQNFSEESRDTLLKAMQERNLGSQGKAEKVFCP